MSISNIYQLTVSSANLLSNIYSDIQSLKIHFNIGVYATNIHTKNIFGGGGWGGVDGWVGISKSVIYENLYQNDPQTA